MRKIYYPIAFIFVCLSGIGVSYSEVVPRSFSIINLDEFPDYTFYFFYQTYPYHNNFQKGPVIQKELLQGSVHRGGEGNDAVYIMAKDNEGKIYRSNILVGGQYHTGARKVSQVEDRFRIVNIRNGVIKLTCDKECISMADGNRNEILGTIFSGSIISPGDAGKAVILIAPMIFGLLVALLFYIRHKATGRMNYRGDGKVLQKE